jgi:hypothetical protein
MASNEYHFITRWQVKGSVGEVSSILTDTPALPRWWPSVYLSVQPIETDGGAEGNGKTYRLHTRGWLPYTLDWTLRLTESRSPLGFSLEATGDLNGRGVWTFQQDGPKVDVIYDWRIRADKLLLRFGSFLLKPVFEANHRWAMQRGEESLKLELERRRCDREEERAMIPAPPGPARSSTWLLGVISLGLLFAVAYGFLRPR